MSQGINRATYVILENCKGRSVSDTHNNEASALPSDETYPVYTPAIFRNTTKSNTNENLPTVVRIWIWIQVLLVHFRFSGQK